MSLQDFVKYFGSMTICMLVVLSPFSVRRYNTSHHSYVCLRRISNWHESRHKGSFFRDRGQVAAPSYLLTVPIQSRIILSIHQYVNQPAIDIGIVVRNVENGSIVGHEPLHRNSEFQLDVVLDAGNYSVVPLFSDSPVSLSRSVNTTLHFLYITLTYPLY